MAPHGRRRFSNFALCLSLFFLFVFTASAASAVLGIDLGTEYIKAALVKPGIPLEIVLTKDSKRKETAAVAFKGLRLRVNSAENEAFPERIYGGDAVALAARFPGEVYQNLKQLVGLDLKSDIATEYQERYPGLEMVELPETGTVAFKTDTFVKEEEPWLVVELLAMELENIRANAETMAGKGSTVQDVVITVPSFYTVEERRAVMMGAELAGLRVLSLISDGLAVGLNYATSRTFPTVNDGGKPDIHLVYDMGAGSTTVTVLKFQGRTVKDVGKYNKTIQEVQVLGTGWDRTLGGDALNSIILEDMITKFTSMNKLKTLGLTPTHVKSHGRTMAKLWKESERIRHVLSANIETQSSFEGLYYEDVNFKYKLTRTELEDIASTFSQRVQNPLTEALESAKLSLADLDSVILHGGAVRTPLVQKRLEAAIKDIEKIRTNVNSDEAAVFGAAFKGATISPSFRVKEIKASDIAVYPVFASWAVEGKDKQQKLFVPTSQVGAEKQVSFKITEDFSFNLFQQNSLSLVDIPVSEIRTQNLTESVKQLTDKFGCALGDISTKFAIRLSPADGFPEVVSGTVSCEVADTKKGTMVDGMKDFLGFGSKKGDQEPLKDDDSTESSTSPSASETSTSTSSSSAESQRSDTKVKEKVDEKSKDVKKKLEIIYIGIQSEVAGSKIKPESLQRMKKRLAAFDSSDRSRILREETLNTLEGYTYKLRDILEDEAFIAVSTEAQREEIEAKSNDASMWLYGDGAEANRETLKARLEELRGLVKPVNKRKEEAVKRPDAIQKLEDAVNQANSTYSMFKQQRDVMLSSQSASSSLTSASSTTTTPASTEDDINEFPDLDDEPIMSSSTTSTIPEIPKLMYSEEELASLAEKQEATKKWLVEKLAEQEKLSPTDDPIVLSSDLAAKSKELNDEVMALLTKQLNTMRTPPKPKKAKTTKTPTTKTGVTKAAGTESSTVEAGGSRETQSPKIEQEMEGAHKVTQEEMEQASREAKAKGDKMRKKDKAKTNGKGKVKNEKGKGKAKRKEKGKEEGHGEL